MLVEDLQEEAKSVVLAVSVADPRRCLVAGRNSVHLPLVLGMQSATGLLKDTIRMVFGLIENNKTLKDGSDGSD